MRLSRLDGIRALAILTVFAHHDMGFVQGWFGVDVFFVLSGFLITGILSRDPSNDSFWTPFYVKRATRILPPLVFCFIGAALVYSVPWRQVGLYYALFAANVAETFYPAKGNPLGVLWSLAIEEHFYLIWPFAIRYLNRRQLLWLLTVVIVAEPMLRAGITPFLNNYLPVYYLTPFRLDGLAAGSLLAVLVEDPSSTNFLVKWSGQVAAVLFALLALLFTRPAFQRETNSWWFNGFGYTLIIAFCFFFLAAVYFKSDSRLSRVLAWRPLVFLGTISYGFYLFHPIIMRAMDRFGAEIGFPYRHRLSPATFLLSVTVSWLSFRFYEKPITRWGHRKAAQI